MSPTILLQAFNIIVSLGGKDDRKILSVDTEYKKKDIKNACSPEVPSRRHSGPAPGQCERTVVLSRHWGPVVLRDLTPAPLTSHVTQDTLLLSPLG